MKLRHATLARNLPSIDESGLLCSKSRGKLPVVWLHAPSKSAWAMVHTVKRHGGRIENVVVLEVTVPRRWLKRSTKRGLWYVARDLPVHRIRQRVTFHELAGASTER
jgi:hypothetical protein